MIIRPLALLRPLITLCLLCATTVEAADERILIITTSDSNYQQQLSTTIYNQLKGTDHQAGIIDAASIDENIIAGKELVIAIGKDEVTVIRKNSFSAAILSTLTNSTSKDSERAKRVNQVKIHMTQPLCRQFRLIRSLNPEWKTVGLLLSEKNGTRASMLSACGKRYGLTTRTYTVNIDSDLITALNSALSNSDVLLSIPDPAIYNSRSIKSILLTSYRHRVPIIGFSESFANAGAIAAVHTSAEQLGKQVARIIDDYYKNKYLSRSTYYPSDFTVTTNLQVARSLEININDREKIEAQLRAMEPDRE